MKLQIRNFVADVLMNFAGLGGAGLIAYGTWLIYPPAGFIVGGALLLAGALLTARGAQ